ncbi:hypothetical protein Hdeb2414_s0010g00338321 [Helianthus debilis subsp. tardiflorus]
MVRRKTQNFDIESFSTALPLMNSQPIDQLKVGPGCSSVEEGSFVEHGPCKLIGIFFNRSVATSILLVTIFLVLGWIAYGRVMGQIFHFFKVFMIRFFQGFKLPWNVH